MPRYTIQQFNVSLTVGKEKGIIYFTEENPTYIEAVRHFFEAMEKGDFMVVTSTITLLEVLVHPLRNNNGIWL